MERVFPGDTEHVYWYIAEELNVPAIADRPPLQLEGYRLEKDTMMKLNRHGETRTVHIPARFQRESEVDGPGFGPGDRVRLIAEAGQDAAQPRTCYLIPAAMFDSVAPPPSRWELSEANIVRLLEDGILDVGELPVTRLNPKLRVSFESLTRRQDYFYQLTYPFGEPDSPTSRYTPVVEKRTDTEQQVEYLFIGLLENVDRDSPLLTNRIRSLHRGSRIFIPDSVLDTFRIDFSDARYYIVESRSREGDPFHDVFPLRVYRDVDYRRFFDGGDPNRFTFTE